MADLPRPDDFLSDFFAGVQTSLGGVGIDLRPLSRWSTLGAGLAQMAVRSSAVAVRTFDAQVLDRSEGGDLETYCRRRGPVVRFGAIKARGVLTMTRATAGAGSGEIPAGTEVRIPLETGGSVVAVTRASRSVGASDLTATVEVEAQSAGSASSVGTVAAALALTGQPAALWDATLLPTSISLAGGSDAELDEPMRERQRLWERARQGATRAAVMFGARLVPGVRHVVYADVRDPHLGAFCNLYVGDVNWQSTAALREEVTVELERWRGHSPLNVRGMTQSDVTVAGTIRMARPIANYSVLALKTAAVQAALDFFDKRVDPYQYDLATLQGRIARIHDEVASVSLTSPAASVTSPISPSAFKLAGYLPASLTRYRTKRSLIALEIEGPV